MWLETIAALMFLVGLWPIWLIGALGWGFLKGLYTLLEVTFMVIGQPDTGIEMLFLVPLAAVIEAAKAAWSIPAWAWEWAKYSHPIIAAILGFLGMVTMRAESRQAN